MNYFQYQEDLKIIGGAPYVLYNRDFLYYLMRQVMAAIKKHKYKRPYPESGSRTVRVIDHPFLFGDSKVDID
ncbi:MAG: hypothetical protein DWB56_07520 [Candidatus Jettenia sp.]|nr:MAG: hypothetical protein EDM77_04465 [Candidatus Jettenia sp. AMX1]MBC6928797.1 hypothetical protein [Candidatus Jettenia sp.]MCE7880109.1 hypothetical protein [Candidatus Jettenia sp. AMX1]MCQ3926890.1 hypothetical protein [Candidatus Jettenia sp.]GJQ44415.1 MAG: hypothetical protein JETCAE04_01690 [Candidatus Jettenia caeni]